MMQKRVVLGGLALLFGLVDVVVIDVYLVPRWARDVVAASSNEAPEPHVVSATLPPADTLIAPAPTGETEQRPSPRDPVDGAALSPPSVPADDASAPLPSAVAQPRGEATRAAASTRDTEVRPEQLRDLVFSRDSAELTPNAARSLQRAVQILSARPDLQVLVRGHACPLGEPTHNLALSERRAMVVREFLARHGIAEERVAIEAVGQNDPVTRGGSAVLSRSRRVQLLWR